MKNTCPPAPLDKKNYLTDVGQILVKSQGKKRYYKPEEVKKASKKSKYYNTSGADWHCWAMCIFSSHEDFDLYHNIKDETCDYVAMKTEMLQALTLKSSANGLDVINLDIDTSWLNFGDVFGGVLNGIGQFVFAIFEDV
jgi:hypothetical protein